MEKVTALDGAKIADAVYHFYNIDEYEIVKYIDKATNTYKSVIYDDQTTDLQMALYTNGTIYVVAFRGTFSLADVGTDLGMFGAIFKAGLADQFTPAGVTLANWIRDYTLSSSNTTIVGHSLGGALAQYFGATTGYETLTYNAYGIGAELNGGSYDNITNYVTMHDPVSSLPGSEAMYFGAKQNDTRLVA